MPTAIDIPTRELAESFNRAVVVVNPEWQTEVKEMVEVESVLPERFTGNTYVEDYAKVENVLQPYVGDFAAKGNFKFGSVENKLEVAQIDMLIKATDVAKFFNTRYPKYAQAGRDPMETDFVKEFFGDFVTQAIYRELQEISINGVRVERTEGSTAPFLTTFTGFDKRFNDLATAGKLNEIVTGAITASNVVEKVQFAMNELPQKLKWKKGVIRMSKEMAKWYSERYKALHPNATAINNNPTGTITQVDEYQVVIEPWECMFGKNYFVIDMQPDNISNMLVVHHDEVPTMPVLRFEADKRNIAVMGEMYRCYGLRRYEHTFRSKAA